MKFVLELTVGASQIEYIDVGGFDSCSIGFVMMQGASFLGGVVSIRKANTQSGTPFDFSTAKTVTTPTLTELSAKDWQKAKFLAIQVTTSSTSTARVEVTVELKKNDHTSLVDPIEIEEPVDIVDTTAKETQNTLDETASEERTEIMDVLERIQIQLSLINGIRLDPGDRLN